MKRLIQAGLLAAALLTASPAAAHAILIDSTPAPLSHVPAGRVSVTFRYNSRIDADRSKLTLRHTEANGEDAEQRLDLLQPGRPDVLMAAPTLAPGAYRILWQVLAVDGHITRGVVPFTVDAAPAPSAGAAASAQ